VGCPPASVSGRGAQVTAAAMAFETARFYARRGPSPAGTSRWARFCSTGRRGRGQGTSAGGALPRTRSYHRRRRQGDRPGRGGMFPAAIRADGLGPGLMERLGVDAGRRCSAARLRDTRPWPRSCLAPSGGRGRRGIFEGVAEGGRLVPTNGSLHGPRPAGAARHRRGLDGRRSAASGPHPALPHSAIPHRTPSCAFPRGFCGEPRGDLLHPLPLHGIPPSEAAFQVVSACAGCSRPGILIPAVLKEGR